MLYIGIDLGTSSVKLILMNETGKILNSVSREYPLYFPESGWSEQNPEDWYNETMNGICELVSGCDKEKIAGIGVGGQMHGLVILDKNDKVIRPAILWNDGRCTEETDYLNDVVGKKALSDYTGNIAFAGFTAPKIMWLKKHEPENYNKIHKIMLPKDYIVYRLTGCHSTDFSDASGMLWLDVKNKCWSDEMLKICDVKKEWLPRLYESYDVVGTLKPEVAQNIGILSQVKVVAGAGDNAAAAIGTGTVGNGECNISLGTSGTVFISSDSFGVDSNNSLHSFAHADGKYHLMGCILSAASCNKWWCEGILNNGDYDGEQKNITELGKNQVFFLPYLMGERSPHNDANARGVFFGMSMNTSRKDMTQAVLEGVAFALRDSFEIARKLGISINKANICGGGAKSLLWKRIIADVLNIELTTVVCDEGPAFGGAILAMVGCGEFKSVYEACRHIVKTSESVKPDQDMVKLYDERYLKYREIYPALKGIF